MYSNLERGGGMLDCEKQVWWKRRVSPLGGTYLSYYVASQDRNVNIHYNEKCRKIPASGKK
jgi:hypothetical protein